MKIAFLDRDGTLVQDYPDEAWPGVGALAFLPNALPGLRMMADKGYRIILLTNQYLIGEGYISQARYQALSEGMCERLNQEGIPLLDIFLCPHPRSQGCPCMKPGTGMVEMALQKYPDIDLAGSFMAGDSDCDEELARRCGLRFYRVCGEVDLLSVARDLA